MPSRIPSRNVIIFLSLNVFYFLVYTSSFLGRNRRSIPTGIHSPGNILAGVGRLEAGLNGNFLLGFTHLGTSLQELVGWRLKGNFLLRFTHLHGNILAGDGGLEEGHKENFLLGFTYLGTSLQELVGWRKGSRGTSFWDSLTWEHPCRSW